MKTKKLNEIATSWRNRIRQFSFHGLMKFAAVLGACLFFGGCNVGHRYQRPEVVAPPAYKESEGWKTAQPQDATYPGQVVGDL